MVKKTLNEYKWRPDTDFSKIEVQYIDRLRPEGFATIKGEDIVDMGDKFIFTRDGMIPYHRVIRIKYRDKVIWERLGKGHTHKHT